MPFRYAYFTAQSLRHAGALCRKTPFFTRTLYVLYIHCRFMMLRRVILSPRWRTAMGREGQWATTAVVLFRHITLKLGNMFSLSHWHSHHTVERLRRRGYREYRFHVTQRAAVTTKRHWEVGCVEACNALPLLASPVRALPAHQALQT